MNSLRDLQLAFRLLSRRPGVSAIAMAVLALGISLVTTLFTLINGVVLKGLPFEGAERLFHIGRQGPKRGPNFTPLRDFEAWRAQQTSFEGLGAFSVQAMNLSGSNRLAQRFEGARLTANTLQLLRVKPLHGRGMVAEDELPGAATVVLLGQKIWERDFGADPGVIGQAVKIDGKPAVIAGVMPAAFRFPVWQEIWTNLQPKNNPPGEDWQLRPQVFGRLKEEATLAGARQEFAVIASRLAREWPENQDFPGARIIPYPEFYQDEDSLPLLAIMLAMVTGVFVIACANVAILLLAQAVRRTRELAVRAALGATRAGLLRQLLMESIVIAFCGAAGGLVLANWGNQLIRAAAADAGGYFWWDFSIDGRVLAGTLAATMLAGVLSGLLPAWQASRANIQETLKDESQAASGLRLGRIYRFLVVLQVAISCTLLVMTVLMTKTAVKGQQAGLPYDVDKLLAARIDLHSQPRKESRILFFQQLAQKLEVLPGVKTVALTSREPTTGGLWTQPAIGGQPHDDPRARPMAWLEIIDTNYFKALSVRLVQGREFGAQDVLNSEPVAIVNESFAKRHWPGQSPLGKTVRWFEKDPWATVIGMVPDLKMQGMLSSMRPEGLYFCQNQQGWPNLSLLVRGAGDPLSLVMPLRNAVRDLAPDQAVHNIKTVERAVTEALSGQRFLATMFTLFGGAAVFLAAVGLYAMMSLSVAQRTHEFGIRFALGAQPAQVLRGVMGEGARYLVIGLALGLLLALALSRPLAAFLTGVSPNDPAVYGLVMLAIIVVAALATWLPAWRATKVDPMVALRCE